MAGEASDPKAMLVELIGHTSTEYLDVHFEGLSADQIAEQLLEQHHCASCDMHACGDLDHPLPEEEKAKCRECCKPSALRKDGKVWSHFAPDHRHCLGVSYPPADGEPRPHQLSAELMSAVLTLLSEAGEELTQTQVMNGLHEKIPYAIPFETLNRLHQLGWVSRRRRGNWDPYEEEDRESREIMYFLTEAGRRHADDSLDDLIAQETARSTW